MNSLYSHHEIIMLLPTGILASRPRNRRRGRKQFTFLENIALVGQNPLFEKGCSGFSVAVEVCIHTSYSTGSQEDEHHVKFFALRQTHDGYAPIRSTKGDSPLETLLLNIRNEVKSAHMPLPSQRSALTISKHQADDRVRENLHCRRPSKIQPVFVATGVVAQN